MAFFFFFGEKLNPKMFTPLDSLRCCMYHQWTKAMHFSDNRCCTSNTEDITMYKMTQILNFGNEYLQNRKSYLLWKSGRSRVKGRYNSTSK